MAFTIQDLGDLLALLRQHPEWRDAVRREVLTEQLIELPAIVQRLAEADERLATRIEQIAEGLAQLSSRVDQLTARVEQLTARLDQLAEGLAQLTARVDGLTADVRELGHIVARMDGRLGNLEGWRYEQRFNARARVLDIIRRPVEVNLADLDAVVDARASGTLTDEEWTQLLALDFLLKGRAGRGVDAPETLLALEVSQVVDSRDVERAHRRAALLSRTAGLAAIAVVGGRRLTADAATLAEKLGVKRLIDSGTDA